MTRPSRLQVPSAVALVGLLTLTGCSDKPSGTSGEIPEGPLTAILNSQWGDYDSDEANRQLAEVENLVAECMAAEGFDYTPQDYSGLSMSLDEQDLEARNTEEWVATNGYGFTMIASDESPTDEEPANEFVDANEEYVSGLSETEATAYYLALNGDQSQMMTEENLETYEYRWEDAGCQGAAQHEVTGDAVDIYSDPRFEDLVEAITEFYVSGEKDPRMVELSTKWSDCMADAGFSEFTTPDDAMMSVSEAQNALYNYEGDEEDYVEPSAEALAEVREVEIATALADFRCKEKTDWEKIGAEVTLELETAFVKDNKAALDELVAVIEESKK